MRISDWSSDVCSSDLVPGRDLLALRHRLGQGLGRTGPQRYPRGRPRGGGDRAVRDVPVRMAVRHLHRGRDPARRADGDGLLSVVPRMAGVRSHDRRRGAADRRLFAQRIRSEENTSELPQLMRISYAVFCLKKKIQIVIITYK